MGIGINANSNNGVKSVTVKNRDGSKAGTITIHSAAKKKTKKLQYRYKRISNQIIQAKTSGSARRVLASAKVETVNLRRKRSTGDYNNLELRRAIIHAERMERIAKKRMKHLQQEESLEKGGSGGQMAFDEEDMEEKLKEMEEDFAGLDTEEIRQLMQELQEEIEQIQQENGLEELTQIVQVNMDPEELEQLKKKHRAQEMREIMEADMKYLKALFDQLEKERQENSSPSSGVSLELNSVDIPVQIDERSAADIVSEAAAVSAEGGMIDVSI